MRELKRQINSLYFERSGLSAKPELLSAITNRKAETTSPTDIVKSVYAFEFLGLKTKDAVEESDLETALLDHLQDFMMEMGNGFKNSALVEFATASMDNQLFVSKYLLELPKKEQLQAFIINELQKWNS